MVKTKKYFYDYPENRELGKLLNSSERNEIAEYLGFTKVYINQIFLIGNRTNEQAIAIAKVIIEQKNEIKQDRINRVNRILNNYTF